MHAAGTRVAYIRWASARVKGASAIDQADWIIYVCRGRSNAKKREPSAVRLHLHTHTLTQNHPFGLRDGHSLMTNHAPGWLTRGEPPGQIWLVSNFSPLCDIFLSAKSAFFTIWQELARKSFSFKASGMHQKKFCSVAHKIHPSPKLLHILAPAHFMTKKKYTGAYSNLHLE